MSGDVIHNHFYGRKPPGQHRHGELPDIDADEWHQALDRPERHIDDIDAVLVLLTQQHTDVTRRLTKLENLMTAFADVPAEVAALAVKLEAATARIEAKLAETDGTVDLTALTADVDKLDAIVPAPAAPATPVLDENGNPVSQ